MHKLHTYSCQSLISLIIQLQRLTTEHSHYKNYILSSYNQSIHAIIIEIYTRGGSMRNLLTGNGINIQFDKTNYTPQQIVLRILKNCDCDDFPSHIIIDSPYLLKKYLGQLFLEAREILEDNYDIYAFGTDEKNSLNSFKKRYKKNILTLRMTDICFEDYYLIHDLICHKNNIQNPNKFCAREAMRIAYLYAIYNDGKLNQLYLNYSQNFITYLSGFDKIFTTNYDSNIESALGKQIYHVHGQFDKKSAVYDASSFRNQLPDAPIKDYDIDEKYYYLYSNALTTHCGAYKEYELKQYPLANSAIEKMANAYLTDEKIRQDIDSWIHNTNTLTANLGYSIQLKAANPTLSFTDNYHFEIFKSITGHLEILGLSPWNDFHIFESINQASLNSCTFYYFNIDECETITKLLPALANNNKLVFSPVIDFWKGMNV